MKKMILIAEDSMVNRRILHKLLDEEYEVLDAADGAAALEVMRAHAEYLSAVILDIGMPKMTGFEVLEVMQADASLRNLPVIVATGDEDSDSEERALELGAWDFVTKPYNGRILHFRLHNAIRRSQLHYLERLQYQAEHDSLTGLHNAQKFYETTRKMLDANPQMDFAVLRFDIDRFKQFNSFFGMERGNAFLRYAADMLRKFAGKYRCCTYARIEGDVFAACVSLEDRTTLLRSIEEAQAHLRAYTKRIAIVSVYGVYEVRDRALAVNTMVDRATLAARTCKGNYVNTVAFYNEEMGKSLVREQEVINEMDSALRQEQFVVYYQPKYNIDTGLPCGAEALVRWQHPDKGLIMPGAFIPVFEKNGFVAKLDSYVWERTCRDLKRWKEQGVAPHPVSVNISRVNLSDPDLVQSITELVKRHDIEPSLLQLEITESAYMDNPGGMAELVKSFHKQGFTILMDDFGSGYSSLNTLKEVSVDILKLDMNFLSMDDNNEKAKKILASIIRMAEWIGMPAVAEGVEVKPQKDFLQSVGCQVVQGYLYARPMPVDQYEILLRDPLAATKKF